MNNTRIDSPNGLERQETREFNKEKLFTEAVQYVREALSRNIDEASPNNRRMIEFVLSQ